MEELKNDDQYNYYDVKGAGMIKISKSSNFSTMNEVGFSFGVEWGRHEFVGGVLPKDEAIKLANFILRTLNLNELLPDNPK